MSFDELAALSMRMDDLYDQFPEHTFTATKEDLVEWKNEILPMFQYNGIVPQANAVDDATFISLLDGERHNHLLGYSDCQHFIHLNARMENPHSSWYNSEDLVSAVAHELAHTQQTDAVCQSNKRSLVENSAQIASLEVLASLATGSNKEALRALVGEIRDISLTAALGVAMKTQEIDKFMKLHQSLSPGALSAARFDRSRRYWKDHIYGLEQIIEDYSTAPLTMIIDAIRNHNNRISGLAFPPVYEGEEMGIFHYPPVQKPIILDDLAYFFAHAEDMVGEAAYGT